MSLVTADRITQLKQQIDAECKRRKYTGSVENLPTTYKYDNAPAKDKIVMVEHFKKAVEEIQYINNGTIINPNNTSQSVNMASIDSNKTLIQESSIEALENAATYLSNYKLQNLSTGCNSSCTGLCNSGCAEECKGTCATTCISTCVVTCVSSCGVGGSCTGTCYSSCGVGGSCTGTCYSSCGVQCSGSCTGTCSSGCQGGCYGSCGGNCSGGCIDTCYGSCITSCTGSCTARCQSVCIAACSTNCVAVCAPGNM